MPRFFVHRYFIPTFSTFPSHPVELYHSDVYHGALTTSKSAERDESPRQLSCEVYVTVWSPNY